MALNLFCVAASCCAMHLFPQIKSVQMKQKGKKYTSNMRSHNEVIQVRCVEIKLKVNINNILTTSTSTGDERDEARGHKPSPFILSSYSPSAAGQCLVRSVISPFFHRPFGYVITAVLAKRFISNSCVTHPGPMLPSVASESWTFGKYRCFVV